VAKARDQSGKSSDLTENSEPKAENVQLSLDRSRSLWRIMTARISQYPASPTRERRLGVWFQWRLAAGAQLCRALWPGARSERRCSHEFKP
jgi:hypothetical protein